MPYENWYIRAIMIAGIIVVLLAIGVKITWGAIIYQEPNNTIESPWGSNGTAGFAIPYTSTSSQNVCGFGFIMHRAANATATGNFYYEYRQGGGAPASGTLKTSNLFPIQNIPGSANNWYDINFSNCYAITPSTTNWFNLRRQVASDTLQFSAYGSTIGSPNQWLYHFDSPAGGTDKWLVGSGRIAFRISGAQSSSSFIRFSNPLNNATTTDFGYWYLEINSPSSTILGNRVFTVEYSRFSSSSYDYVDQFNADALRTGLYTEAIPKTQSLIFPPLIEPTHWYARATISESSTIIASEKIEFDVYYGATGIQPNGTSTLTATCDPNSGFFANSFCNILVYLFVPSPSTLNNFTVLRTSLSKKPPFGYVTAITNGLAGLTIGTSTDQLRGVAQISIFGTLRTIIQYALYAYFGFWIFNRIRHFQL